MTEPRKKRSTLLLLLGLLRELAVFIKLELQLAVAEFKRNIGSAKRGAIQMAIGLVLLIVALLLITFSAVAVLALALPLWLASLIVGALFTASGLCFLLTGKNRISKNAPIPRESLERIRKVSRKLME